MSTAYQFRLCGDGAWHLGVAVRRSFTWSKDGAISVSERQRAPVDDEGTAFKPKTDVVVEGHVYAPTAGAREVISQVEIEGLRRRIRACGKREVVSCNGGSSEWSRAEPFDRIQLARSNAYGGFDEVAFSREGDDDADAAVRLGAELSIVSRFAYPRNAQGIGFYMVDNREANIGRPVPSLDDPDDPVLPERLLRESTRDWIDAPVPAWWGWSEPDDFPRSHLLGFTADHLSPKRRVREMELGALEPPDLERRSAPQGLEGLPYGLVDEPRAHLAAAPGMATRRLVGGETIRLVNLEPNRPERLLRVPRASPALRVRPPGCNWLDLEPQIDSLVIRPDDLELALVFTAKLRVAGQYPDDELQQVELAIDWPSGAG